MDHEILFPEYRAYVSECLANHTEPENFSIWLHTQKPETGSVEPKPFTALLEPGIEHSETNESNNE